MRYSNLLPVVAEKNVFQLISLHYSRLCYRKKLYREGEVLHGSGSLSVQFLSTTKSALMQTN